MLTISNIMQDKVLAEMNLYNHLLTAERAVLFTLNFTMKTEYSFNYITRMAKSLGLYIPSNSSSTGTELCSEAAGIIQKAFTFVNRRCWLLHTATAFGMMLYM